MEVSQQRIDEILKFFNPDCRYLQKASCEYPKAQGLFRIGPTFYTATPVDHATALEIQLCFNQLSYAAFGEWMHDGRMGDTIPFEQFLNLMKENMYVVDAHLRFRKMIQKNEVLTGNIEVIHAKKRKDLYLAHIACSIEGKFRGHVEFGLKS